MFQHFIGRVYLFHDPPVEELPFVDFPIFSQNEDVPEKLLMQMDEEDLSAKSKQRVKDLSRNKILSIETIRQNAHIEPRSQIGLASYIKENDRMVHSMLRWRGFPTYDQLKFTCELIWEYFVDSPRLGNISSGSQLAFKINRLRIQKNIKALIGVEVKGNDLEKINEAIEDTLDFVRFWAQYNFPKYLMALNRIQEEIYKEVNMTIGDYSFFASQIECLFTDPLFVALDEYGLPIQTAEKIKNRLNTDGNLDSLLLQIKELRIQGLNITAFEKDLLRDLKKYI